VTFFERSACVENCPPKCELFLYFIYGWTSLQEIEKQREMLCESLKKQLTPREP
jgi:hypothetical protein